MITDEEKELLLQQVMKLTFVVQCKAADLFVTAEELKDKCQKLVGKEQDENSSID